MALLRLFCLMRTLETFERVRNLGLEGQLEKGFFGVVRNLLGKVGNSCIYFSHLH